MSQQLRYAAAACRRRLWGQAAPRRSLERSLPSPPLQVGLAWVLAALHTLAAVVFATLDPLRRVDHGAFCRSPEDEACRAALAGGRLCDLPRDAWQWRAP